MSGNKGFLKEFNSKRSSKESIGPILAECCHLTSRNEEKNGGTKCFFSLSLIILLHLGPPSPLNRMTTSVGTVSLLRRANNINQALKYKKQSPFITTDAFLYSLYHLKCLFAITYRLQ